MPVTMAIRHHNKGNEPVKYLRKIVCLLALATPAGGCVTNNDYASVGGIDAAEAKQSARVSANHYRYPSNRPVGWPKGD